MKQEKILYEVPTIWQDGGNTAWVDVELITAVKQDYEYDAGSKKKVPAVQVCFSDNRSTVCMLMTTWEKLKKAAGIKIKVVKL